MLVSSSRGRLRVLALSWLACACSADAAPSDWRNRELAWKYGPTTGTASLVHLEATGTKGSGPIAKGWKLHLVDGTRMTLSPYQLADQHALFGTVRIAVGLFDKQSQPIETVVSDVITADGGPYSFEIDEATAKRAWDAILWFRRA